MPINLAFGWPLFTASIADVNCFDVKVSVKLKLRPIPNKGLTALVDAGIATSSTLNIDIALIDAVQQGGDLLLGDVQTHQFSFADPGTKTFKFDIDGPSVNPGDYVRRYQIVVDPLRRIPDFFIAARLLETLKSCIG